MSKRDQGLKLPMTADVVAAIEITATAAAELIGVSRRRIYQLDAADWIKRQGRDRFLLGDVIGGYARFVRNEARRTSQAAASSRVADARARQIEIKTAKELRQLIPQGDVFFVLDKFVGITRSEIESLPARVARSDLNLRKQLDQEVFQLLNRLANRLANIADDLEEEIDDELTEAGAGRPRGEGPRRIACG